MRNMTESEIELKYQQLKNTPSDINEHLGILREYADKCESVAEFGVRSCISLFAFLASKASRVLAVDISPVEVPDVEKLTFVCANDLEIEIVEPIDMLHIDSYHDYNHFKKELGLHAGKVNKYIAAHDVFFFGRQSEDGSKKGLMDALEEFLVENSEWRIVYQTDINNGMIIIERQ